LLRASLALSDALFTKSLALSVAFRIASDDICLILHIWSASIFCCRILTLLAQGWCLGRGRSFHRANAGISLE
jgi:hypothetical protein